MKVIKCKSIMSESDYYRDLHSTAKRAAAAEALSDTEDEIIPPRKSPKLAKATKSKALTDTEDDNARPPKKGKQVKGKEGPEEETTRLLKKPTAGVKKTKKQQTQASGSAILSELFEEEGEGPALPPQQQLWSSVSRYLPTGTLRTAQILDGDFFIELRVFDAAAIKHLPYNKRFDEVQAVLRLQLSHEDSQWDLVKRLFKEGKKKFEKESVFYAKQKKIND